MDNRENRSILLEIGNHWVSLINHNGSYARGNTAFVECAVWHKASGFGEYSKVRGFRYGRNATITIKASELGRFMNAVVRMDKRNG